MYKYRIILKSGASFDIENDDNFYEEESDLLQDHLSGNFEDAPLKFSSLYTNGKKSAMVLRSEIAAIILLGYDDIDN